MNLESAYKNALDYLYSFVDYSLTRNLTYSPEKFNLGRMAALMDLLGNPQDNYAIIHVAGTKGKGSVSALIESALRAAGHSTGFYTSPHLTDYTERIKMNGEAISRAELVEFVEKLKPEIAKIDQLSTFEITTALGFLYFSQKKADIAVIEVGLGGRLDATNVVNPTVSVITSLSYDHMNVLGDTLTKIAGEKAGIIKSGRPVVTSPQKDEALKVVVEIARERNSDCIQVGKDWVYAPVEHSLDGQTLDIWQAIDEKTISTPLRLSIPLLGLHQVDNAATAFAALVTARNAGIAVSNQDIQKGFSEVFWPARFEVLQKNPMLIIDSAHNRDSAMKLRMTLDDYLPDVPVVLLFGASEDKDISGMFAELLPRVKAVVATQSIHPRAMNADKLVELAQRAGVPAYAETPVRNALLKSMELADGEAAVVAAGSIFIAAAVRDVWMELNQNQALTN